MSLKAGDVDRAWNKLGMEINNTGDRHAVLRVNEKIVIRTKRSFGSKNLDGNIPHLIRQQMKLNDKQFKELIDCPLDRAGYIQILRAKGFIDPPPER